MDRLQPRTVDEASRKRLVEAIDERTLEMSLQLETRAISRLLMMPDTLERLRISCCKPFRVSIDHTRVRRSQCLVWGVCPRFNVSRLISVYFLHLRMQRFSDISQDFIDELLQPLHEANEAFEFKAIQRTPIALSQHPWLRVVHPDYNRYTRLDHDPLIDRANRYDNICAV